MERGGNKEKEMSPYEYGWLLVAWHGRASGNECDDKPDNAAFTVEWDQVDVQVRRTVSYTAASVHVLLCLLAICSIDGEDNRAETIDCTRKWNDSPISSSRPNWPWYWPAVFSREPLPATLLPFYHCKWSPQRGSTRLDIGGGGNGSVATVLPLRVVCRRASKWTTVRTQTGIPVWWRHK